MINKLKNILGKEIIPGFKGKFVHGKNMTLAFWKVKKGSKIFLEAANPAYEPIELNLDEVVFQGKLLAVWRKV